MPVFFGFIGAAYLLVIFVPFLSKACIWQRKVKLKAKGKTSFGEDAGNAGLAMATALLFHAGLMTLVATNHYAFIAWSLTLTLAGFSLYSLSRDLSRQLLIGKTLPRAIPCALHFACYSAVGFLS